MLVEKLLYDALMRLARFHRFVGRVHAKVNRIPYRDPRYSYNDEHMKVVSRYVPTKWHKINAFRVLWWDEMKRSVGMR